MSGKNQSVSKLNHTLSTIVDKFEEHGIKKWFVGYGTLLGMIREKSCIDGDDDIDILLHHDEYDKCAKVLAEIPMGPFYPRSRKLKNIDKYCLLRREENEEFTPIDVYICSVNDEGDYFDEWDSIIWKNCYVDVSTELLPTIKWNDRTINIPYDHLTKIINKYGETWERRITRGTQAGDGVLGTPNRIVTL